ncbi:MAG TPA: PRC-barrel domain-containing protein [Verrucomicrobiae bacterium]|nr:PRC-barrel domain-containing protein [Verrucomicrobiae bacterium]
MIKSVKEAAGTAVTVPEGKLGHIDDFYFDHERWKIRYAAVDTGDWPSGRRVLIASAVLGKPDWWNARLPAGVTRKKVNSSPALDLSSDVTRQAEESLHRHYGWAPYWQGAEFARAPGAPPPAWTGEPLHSVKSILGFRISAIDGEIGSIHDFLVDDETWIIRYAVVDTGDWLAGRKVLLAPEWIREFMWDRRRAAVPLNKNKIQGSPLYYSRIPLERAYEEELYSHYSQEKYWGTQWQDGSKASRAA